MLGKTLRNRALDLVEHASEERQDYVVKARRIARLHALTHGTVTSEDVRKKAPVPDGMDPRILGAVFRTSEWKRVGFRQTPRASAHCRPISVWKLL